MVKHSPCIKSVATPRRRPATWRDYQIDHSEPHVCIQTFEWPAVSAQAPRPANDQPHQTTRVFSQAELADRLHKCVATIARQRKKGLLAGHKIGGQWLHTEEQIADYMRRTESPLRLYGKGSNDNDPL